MNPFVNIKKRSIELPAGCKDLIDVLQPRGRKLEKATIESVPIIRPERFETSGLTHVHDFVAKLMQSSSEQASLVIKSLDGEMAIFLHSSRRESGIYPVMGLAQNCEAAALEFFSARAIQPSSDDWVGHPGMPTRILGFPLPADVGSAAQLTFDLIREVYELDANAGLEFTYVESEAAS